MDISFTGEETVLLKRILEQYVSDLKSEISDTEKYDWRQSMKQDEAMVKAIIERLSSSETGNRADDEVVIVEETVVIVEERQQL